MAHDGTLFHILFGHKHTSISPIFKHQLIIVFVKSWILTDKTNFSVPNYVHVLVVVKLSETLR